MKTIVIIIQFTIPDIVNQPAVWILSIFGNNNDWEIVFTVIIMPCIMNSFQFLVQDVILRKKEFSRTEEGILREFYIIDDEGIEEILIQNNLNLR